MYSKHATEFEYEHHKMLLEGGLNVPPIVSWDPSTQTLLTQFIQGQTVDTFAPINGVNNYDIPIQLIDQVEHMHKMGYIHGDLNPTNVIISTTGKVYLIDFEFTEEIGCACVTIEEEMMDLVRLVLMTITRLTFYDLRLCKNLLDLCEDTSSSRLPFQLGGNVTYDDLRDAIRR